MPHQRAQASLPADGHNEDDKVVCKVCAASFDNIRDCLAHELQRHTHKQSKHLRQRLNAITKEFTSDEAHNERIELNKALETAQPGREFDVLFEHYVGDSYALNSVFRQVSNCIQTELRCNCKVHCFGSFVTGLALKESDLDLFVEFLDKRFSHLKNIQLFNIVSNALRRSKSFKDIVTIRHARVPIIKCKHEPTGLSVDLNVSNLTSIFNSRFVNDLLSIDTRLRQLFLFLKIWAKKLNIIGRGNMTSYCLVVLIIYYLQQRNLLAPIKELQSNCQPYIWRGINYAYSFEGVHLTTRLTTLDLIKGFFELYNSMNFEGIIIAPYLGRPAQLSEPLEIPYEYSEYAEQMINVEEVTREAPPPFQVARCLCVQDPFELMHNVAKTVSQTNLFYLRKCIALATVACQNRNLMSMPAKIYDYLLFGLGEELIRDRDLAQARPPKQRKQRISLTEQEKPPTKLETPEQEAPISVAVTKQSSLTHIITPSSNELKALRIEFLHTKCSNQHTIYYNWIEYYMEAIRKILESVYLLNLQPTEKEPLENIDSSLKICRWTIVASLDTWTARNFQRNKSQSFHDFQLQQSMKFQKERAQDKKFAVNFRAILTLNASEKDKEIRIELEPLSTNPLVLQRNSPLTKFFKSFKNLLCNFNLKDQINKKNNSAFINIVKI